MRILLSKAHIDEKSWYDVYIDETKPDSVPDERLVYGGGFEFLNESRNIKYPPARGSFIPNLVENDGSHISRIFEKKDKKHIFHRIYTEANFPVMYKDYSKENSFPFADDPISSIKSAWEQIGSPENFVIYLILRGA